MYTLLSNLYQLIVWVNKYQVKTIACTPNMIRMHGTRPGFHIRTCITCTGPKFPINLLLIKASNPKSLKVDLSATWSSAIHEARASMSLHVHILDDLIQFWVLLFLNSTVPRDTLRPYKLIRKLMYIYISLFKWSSYLLLRRKRKKKKASVKIYYI